MNLLKKMSPATIMGEKIKKIIAEHCAEDGDSIDLFTIFGTVNGIRTGEHPTNGPWVAFRGNFEAINHLTGETCRSGEAFLQKPLDAMMQAALAENDEISFSCTITAKRRDDLAVNYEFMVKPHVETSQADPLAHLRALTAKVVPVLSSPVLSSPVSEMESTTTKDEPKKVAKKRGKK